MRPSLLSSVALLLFLAAHADAALVASPCSCNVAAHLPRNAQRYVSVRCAGAPPSLTGGQRRALRAQAGRLAAEKSLHYVSVADIERSRDQVDLELTSVELVRCKFAVKKKAEAKVMAAQLAEEVGAAVAEVLGHTALLYRPSAKRLIKLD